MAKLSEPLKALINASHARPNTNAAPRNIASVYERISKDALSKRVGLPAWLCASTAATMTMNSPDSLLELYKLVNSPPHGNKYQQHQLYTAELMREVGLKCIGLNGVPRTINTLGAFYGGLPKEVQQGLAQRKPQRNLSRDVVDSTLKRGVWLWDSIYHPLTDKLTAKLAQSHPDLPVHIIESEYGSLFSDPTPENQHPSGLAPHPTPAVGRVLTSIMAVACLRAQTGVGPQVVSHVFGLRKAFEDGTADADNEQVEGGTWLATDEGSMWLLDCTDRIVEAIGQGRGSSFAPGMEKGPTPKL